MSEFILELQGIVKKFPGVVALSDVHFQLKKGEIHALMGENGAGKSTFIKIITGVHEPDEGTITLRGKPVIFTNPRDAANQNIAAIYQHSTSYPHLSVTENIFLGHEKTKMGMLDWRRMHEEAKRLLESLGLTIDPRTNMGSLSVAERQVVEISKAVSSQAEILIMDEPTAALSERECEELYSIAEKLRDAGTSIIFISHRIEDMYRLATRVTVLRDSQYIGSWDVKDITHDKLITAMVGREVKTLYPKKKVPIGNPVLEVQHLTRMGFFHDVSFSVRQGEILGLTGLVGAGRSEVCQAIYGIVKPDSGTIKLEGKEIKINHPSEAVALGIGYLPEDRQIQGLILDWEVYKNETLSTLKKYTTLTGIQEHKEKLSAQKLSEELGVKIRNVADKAGSLSGGNQQKVVVAKLLDAEMKVLILDEPTKGVDVAAKAQIHEIITHLVERGYAVILISSELPEVMAVSDRIAVMADGRLVKILDASEASQEKILEAAMNSSKG